MLGNNPDDERLKNQILNAHKTMDKHDCFIKQPLRDQFDMCTTICRIAIHTSMEDLSKAKLSQNKNQRFECSIYRTE